MAKVQEHTIYDVGRKMAPEKYDKNTTAFQEREEIALHEAGAPLGGAPWLLVFSSA